MTHPVGARTRSQIPDLSRLEVKRAALIYKAKASRGDAEPFEAVMNSTYALVDGQPGLALYQQTTSTH